MNAGESQPFFIDSNIWLYRFIVNCSDPNAIPKQQIATNITNQENLIISTQVVNEVCSNLIRKAGFNNLQIQNLLEELTQGCEILPVSLETLEYAVKLRDRYLISFWDSLIVGKWSDKSKVNRGSQESRVRSQQELPELHFLRQTTEFMSDYLVQF